MKRDRPITEQFCSPCGAPAVKRWKGEPACQPCYARALFGGPFWTVGGFAAIRRAERRKKVRDLVHAKKSDAEIARRLKIDVRTVRADRKARK